jgi:2-isopropylmalate synthase
MDRVYLFDTTLRDGEQSPGASMSVEQKCEVAQQLGRLGVDAIEAGFPISSPQQFEACRLIAKQVKGTTIAALARAVEKDIDAAIESIGGAEHPRIHTFLATSPIHMEYKLRKKPDEVVEMAVRAVKYARSKVAEVEFSPEDGSRSELPFLCRIIEEVIKAGASVINVPDTVGYAVPQEFGRFIAAIRAGVPSMHKAVLSVHCHNDLGLAVANSIAAIEAGARQVEVTVNGIGERAGNAALEELVMALTVEGPAAAETGVNTRQIWTPRLVANTIAAHPAQQARGRRERLQPRVGHPPGRGAEEARDLRDHDPRGRRPRRQPHRARPALGPARIQEPSRGAGPESRRGGAAPGLRPVPGRGRPKEGGLRR